MISFFLFVFCFFCVWKRGGNEYPQIKKTKILRICLDYLTTHFYYLKQFSPHLTIPSPPKANRVKKGDSNKLAKYNIYLYFNFSRIGHPTLSMENYIPSEFNCPLNCYLEFFQFSFVG